MSSLDTRPHILAAPFYLPGHEIPLLHLCQYLVSSGSCRVSILQAPPYTGKNTLAPTKAPASFSHPLLKFHTVPLHLLPEVESLRDFQNIKLFHDAFDGLGDLIAEEWRGENLTCIITDVLVGWGKQLAEALSIPWISFWTSTTTELAVYFNIPRSIPPNSNGVSSISIRGLPEIKSSEYSLIDRLQSSEFPLKFILEGFVRKVGLINHSDRVLVNTALALEGNAVESLKSSGVNVVPVGPLHLLNEPHPNGASESDPNKVLPWLDQQPDASVLFTAFGTTVQMPPGQIQELASALESIDDLRFVWVVRTLGDIEQIPATFSSISRFSLREGNASESLQDNDRRGVVADWVPQRRVLKHPAINGFLTHCGWNSVLESITSGVPMITRPFVSDQVLTSKLLEEQWGVSVRIRSSSPMQAVGKQEIVDAIEKYRVGIEERSRRALELGAMVKEEMEAGRGASRMNLESLVKELHSRNGEIHE